MTERNSYILSTTLRWNCTDLGDITDYIVDDSAEKINNFYTYKIRVKNTSSDDVKEVRVVQEKYNPTVVAGDMLKCYFNVFSIRYHIISIDETKYLISRYEDNTWLNELCSSGPLVLNTRKISASNKMLNEELKRAFAAQWLIGSGSFCPTNILIRNHSHIGLYPTIYLDKYNKSKGINERFTKSTFGGTENFYNEVCKLLPHKDTVQIILDIREILQEYSPDDMKWRNGIIERIQLCKANCLAS